VFTSAVNHGDSVRWTSENAQATSGAGISDDLCFSIALHRHQGTPHINMVQFYGIVIANDCALVTTDALSFFHKGHRALATFGVRTLFATLTVQGCSNPQGFFLAALSQLVCARHVATSTGRSPSNLATDRLTNKSPKQ
jgi:hypothetical protein